MQNQYSDPHCSKENQRKLRQKVVSFSWPAHTRSHCSRDRNTNYITLLGSVPEQKLSTKIVQVICAWICAQIVQAITSHKIAPKSSHSALKTVHRSKKIVSLCFRVKSSSLHPVSKSKIVSSHRVVTKISVSRNQNTKVSKSTYFE